MHYNAAGACVVLHQTVPSTLTFDWSDSHSVNKIIRYTEMGRVLAGLCQEIESIVLSGMDSRKALYKPDELSCCLQVPYWG